jgi:hypothetical protein
MIRSLMFIRGNPEESADIGMKKIPMHRTTRAIVVEGIAALPRLCRTAFQVTPRRKA